MADEDWLIEHRRRVAQFPEDVREAHKQSANHRDEIMNSAICGCFYCCQTFAPDSIVDWVDFADPDDASSGTTAICPRCGIDSVIGDRSGFEPTPELLQKMNRYWF